MKYWYRSKDEQHEIDVKDETEARHWRIAHLDQSIEWELSEYKVLFEVDGEEDYEYWYENLVDYIEELVEFPVQLEAVNSNWQGKTGVADADTAEELVSKCMSFGNDWLSLRLDNKDGLYFRTSSHDVPMGFNIYIEKQDENRD
jgi:uncharacterized protein YllA (UPF0747 family)